MRPSRRTSRSGAVLSLALLALSPAVHVLAAPAPGSSASASTSASLPTVSSALSSTTSAPSAVSSSSVGTTSSTSVSTAVPSPALPSSATVSEGPQPTLQPTCDSPLYCPGEILQTVQLAQLYSDAKTFVDKPTVRPLDEVVAAFYALGNNNSSSSSTNNTSSNSTNVSPTVAELVAWVDTYFGGEGQELVPATLDDFVDSPKFLDNVSDPTVRGWLSQVHGYWKDLARSVNDTSACEGCVSSFIPLNHSFVIPGGRFRELYYWDTYWVLEGLLKSELYSVARNEMENFLDLLDKFGFIPNGNRIYYLNRSQPPLFTQMLDLYQSVTKDLSLLPRALPLLEKEMSFWRNNRTISLRSPYSGKTHNVTRYAVHNSAPRPEGYTEDYQTVEGDPSLSNAQMDSLYEDLASGAESGEDYSAARWSTSPFPPDGNISNTTPALRHLNTAAQVPVDLNSELYRNEVLLAEMYGMLDAALKNSSSSLSNLTERSQDDDTAFFVRGFEPLLAERTANLTRANVSMAPLRAQYWREQAAARKAAILDLFWDPERMFFYDFNTTASARATTWTASSLVPYWAGIVPSEVLESEKNAQAAFAGLRYIMDRYNGSVPNTLLQTGQQWDLPNAWPPSTYIAVKALQSLPSNLTKSSLPKPPASNSSYALVPSGQLGLAEGAMALQPWSVGNGTVNPALAGHATSNVTSSNATSSNAKGWTQELVVEIANRYITSALCSWHSTGGSVPGLLPRLPDDQLNATHAIGQTGIMFEKFSAFDVDAAGGGGEYTVQTGFGWTNGVAIWLGAELGDVITKPQCPPIIVGGTKGSTSSRKKRSPSGYFA